MWGEESWECDITVISIIVAKYQIGPGKGGGGIDFILSLSGKVSREQGRLGIAALALLQWTCADPNNTVAIVMSGSIAKRGSQR